MIQETRHSIAEILSRQPLFRGLDEEDLKALAAHTCEYRVRKHEVLFNKGDTPQGIHVVVMGQVKLFIPSTQGWEKVIHMEGAGSTFGEAVAFLDKPYPVSAQATQDSIVLIVDKDALNRALESSPLLYRKMLAACACACTSCSPTSRSAPRAPACSG